MLCNIIYKMDMPLISKREICIGIEYDEEQHKSFAIFPDSMIDGILETQGLCDLELSEDGKEVVSFTALEIPDFMKESSEPTAQDDTDAMLIDHEYRLTLLELGLTE